MKIEVNAIKVNGTIKKQEPGGEAKLVQRFERKFAIRPGNIGFAEILLRQVCRPDREYPEGVVHSLYFDTADLDQYERSASGEYRKNKVRIRWYVDSLGQQEEILVYVELKSRQGFASSKQRRKVIVPVARLAVGDLGRGILGKWELIEILAGFGYFPEKPLRPVIVISYRRRRYNEMQTGVRVSFDSEIRASVVARDLGRMESEVRLREGVIEVKGPTLELPVTLRRIKLLDTDWSRFSKYGYCLDAHFTAPGSVGRLSPSGRILVP